ncbi:alginate O-acetyltransferase AlgF [Pseudomonas wadenswilerensis]
MSRLRGLIALPLLALAGVASAEVALYPTGPSEDSAFLRFVNVAPGALKMEAAGSKASLALDDARQVSDYLPVPANKAIKGTLSRAGHDAALDLQVAPGEFATVFAFDDGGKIAQRVVREQPDDFNALKASLAFVSLDPACQGAALRPAGRTADLFKDAADGSVQRRSINPVKLSVQLVCANANVGNPLDLGELKAGERYSVMLLPGAQGPRLLGTTDTLAN